MCRAPEAALLYDLQRACLDYEREIYSIDLIEWIRPLAPTLKRVFLVHGEEKQQDGMAGKLREVYGLDVEIPKRGDTFPL